MGVGVVRGLDQNVGDGLGGREESQALSLGVVIFIAMVIFMPQGLLGFARRWLNR